MSRAEQLATRIQQGADNLIAAVNDLSDAEWETACDGENRTVGVLVHHVGTMYPLEADVVRALVANGGMPGLSWDAVDHINHEHATANAGIDRAAAIDLIRQNVKTAVDAVRELTDEQLDQVATTGLHWQAPLTVQFFVEQHPVAHPYIHLESIKTALAK